MTASITSVEDFTAGQRKQYERVVRDAVEVALPLVLDSAKSPTKLGLDQVLRNGDDLRSRIIAAVVNTTGDLSQTNEMLRARYSPTEIEVEVDYSLSMKEMVEKCHFSVCEEYFFEPSEFRKEPFFKAEGEGKKKVLCALVRLNKHCSISEAFRQLSKLENGFRPGRVEHLLALEADLPWAHRGIPIVALGSMNHVDGDQWSGALISGSGTPDGRSLLIRRDHDRSLISRHYHYLLVQE